MGEKAIHHHPNQTYYRDMQVLHRPEVHGNHLTASKDCEPAQVRQVQQAVYAAHGVHLEPEVRIVR